MVDEHCCLSSPKEGSPLRPMSRFANIIMVLFALLFRGMQVGANRVTPRRLSAEDSVIRGGFIQRQKAPTPLRRGTKIVFVHIPKAAGDSFMIDSPKFMPRGVELRGNREIGLRGSFTDMERTAILLRNPMQHVISQFIMCKYSRWGRRVTRSHGFPNGSMSNVTDGLAEWVRHFLGKRRLVQPPRTMAQGSPSWAVFPHLDRFNCYDPWNRQARALDHGTRFEIQSLKSEASQRPSLSAAMRGLARVSFLGITDLYPVSMCLFQFFSTGAMFPKACSCEDSTVSLKLTHEAHGVPRYSLRDVPCSVLDEVARLVEVDLSLFVHALKRFSMQVDVAEATTGVRLLCGDELRSLEADARGWLQRITTDDPSSTKSATPPGVSVGPTARTHRTSVGLPEPNPSKLKHAEDVTHSLQDEMPIHPALKRSNAVYNTTREDHSGGNRTYELK